MMGRPVVPLSFGQVVAAHQARSRVQAIVDHNRESVEAANRRSSRQLTRLLVRAEAELRAQLADEVARRGDQTFNANDLQLMLVQVRAALGQLDPKFIRLLEQNAALAARLGSKNVVDVLTHFEERTGGGVRPLAVHEALALENPRLRQYPSSVARYGQHTIGVIARQLQQGVIQGKTFREMSVRLAGARGGAGLLVKNRGWADRIVRTEGMAAMAAGAQSEMVQQKARRFPDLARKLIETFDRRTAPDSYVAHGEVRGMNEPFVDGAGRVYLLPPGRPNDRACIIPWRRAWDT
jgi:hypothetical protein